MTDIPGVDQGALDAAAVVTDAPANIAADASPEPESTPDEPESPEDTDYSSWLKDDLIAEAEDRGLDTSGTKAELIARLTA